VTKTAGVIPRPIEAKQAQDPRNPRLVYGERGPSSVDQRTFGPNTPPSLRAEGEAIQKDVLDRHGASRLAMTRLYGKSGPGNVGWRIFGSNADPVIASPCSLDRRSAVRVS
jgi:hypothetical protein